MRGGIDAGPNAGEMCIRDRIYRGRPMWGVLFAVPDIIAGGWVGGNTKSEVDG